MNGDQWMNGIWKELAMESIVVGGCGG